jgi:hypothetical protein
MEKGVAVTDELVEVSTGEVDRHEVEIVPVTCPREVA